MVKQAITFLILLFALVQADGNASGPQQVVVIAIAVGVLLIIAIVFFMFRGRYICFKNDDETKRFQRLRNRRIDEDVHKKIYIGRFSGRFRNGNSQQPVGKRRRQQQTPGRKRGRGRRKKGRRKRTKSLPMQTENERKHKRLKTVDEDVTSDGEAAITSGDDDFEEVHRRSFGPTLPTPASLFPERSEPDTDSSCGFIPRDPAGEPKCSREAPCLVSVENLHPHLKQGFQGLKMSKSPRFPVQTRMARTASTVKRYPGGSVTSPVFQSRPTRSQSLRVSHRPRSARAGQRGTAQTWDAIASTASGTQNGPRPRSLSAGRAIGNRSPLPRDSLLVTAEEDWSQAVNNATRLAPTWNEVETAGTSIDMKGFPPSLATPDSSSSSSTGEDLSEKRDSTRSHPSPLLIGRPITDLSKSPTARASQRRIHHGGGTANEEILP